MIKSRVLLAGVALTAVSAAAHAGLSVTPTVVSDYDFRGITQTANDPAVQLGINYAHDSGFYAFAWGSNLDDDSYPDADLELDLGLGFAGGDAAESFGYDVGVVAYTYPGNSDFNYYEVYAGLSKSYFGLKLWYSPEFAGVSGDTSAFYLDGNATFPLPNDFAIVAHLGYSFGDYWEVFPDADGDDTYFDWSVGVTKTLGNSSLALKYIDGGDYRDFNLANDAFETNGKLWASVSTTLPWKSE